MLHSITRKNKFYGDVLANPTSVDYYGRNILPNLVEQSSVYMAILGQYDSYQ